MTMQDAAPPKGAQDPGEALHQLINGYRVSQAIHVAASLHIADRLAAGPMTSQDLAAAAGVHPGALYRLLRALASADVLHESEGQMFSLTPIGQYLRGDVPGSRRAWAAFSGRPAYWGAWGRLLHSVRTGENAFRHANGIDVWEHRTRHPAEGEAFDAAMREGSLRAIADVSAHCNFARFRRIADVGGGNGSFLASILQTHETCDGILFDQPHVVAAASDVLREAGVAERCTIVGGNFFDAVPAGCEAYLLKFIVHDWEDEQAVALLRNCRRACGPSGRVIVLERILGHANEGLEGKFSDLNMLVSAGGRERTLEEFEALFRAAELAVVSAAHCSGPMAVIEAVPA